MAARTPNDVSRDDAVNIHQRTDDASSSSTRAPIEQTGTEKAEPKARSRSHRRAAPLTAQEEMFCIARVKGHNQTDAYIIAFDASGIEQKRLYDRSSRLGRDKRVGARIEQLKRERISASLASVRSAPLITRDYVRERLLHEASTADNAPSRIRALELLGKDAGMFTDAPQSAVVEKRSSAQVERDLRDRLAAYLQGTAVATIERVVSAEDAALATDARSDSVAQSADEGTRAGADDKLTVAHAGGHGTPPVGTPLE